jgi:hypothetical protein
MTLPLNYDLERITPGERRALEPLLYHCYEATPAEQLLLKNLNMELGEKALALALARMSTLDLGIILGDYQKLRSWMAIVKKYAIDLTGHDDMKDVMIVRDSLQ